jgi:serine/threonine protein kinase
MRVALGLWHPSSAQVPRDSLSSSMSTDQPDRAGAVLARTPASPAGAAAEALGGKGATRVIGGPAPEAASDSAAYHAAGAKGDSLAPGKVIKQYELIRELGRGGMGTVWLARDMRLGRRVAIKFLHLPEGSFRDRFLVEARATARCHHENIIVIHEVNEHAGMPFMVLEFLDGSPLSEVMARTRVPGPRAVQLMVPVVRALVKAHGEGLIHRDLKPDNVFVTRSGTVKVLDFGIAKLFQPEAPASSTDGTGHQLDGDALRAVYRTISLGGIAGTMPYMSPEQWGQSGVDVRTDIWAVGVILFEMVSGQHPVAPLTFEALVHMVRSLDTPLPSVRLHTPELSDGLTRIIDRCLQKQRDSRYASAAALLDELEGLLPIARGRSSNEAENPYPGLAAFQEADAGRFFGRESDIERGLATLREHPLVAVVGPSGVGKSSYVRAGLVPTLKASGQAWEALVLRPGREPLASLASLVAPLISSGSASSRPPGADEHQQLIERFRVEPGHLGAALRAHARQKGAHYVLFVDQFEELYTLARSAADRAVFTRCLAGAADDVAAPLRVVLAMRSDLLDRVGEAPQFQDDIVRGLLLLGPPAARGLERALTQPAAHLGFSFESPRIVEEMLAFLDETPGSLPLLQFAAARLWEARDTQRKWLTQAAYEQMGGVAGTLARHAGEVLSHQTPAVQRLTRSVLLRLVTPERTRSIADFDELRQLSETPDEVDRLVQQLATARLVVIQKAEGASGGSVELVHESLVQSWPTLTRWLDESQEDAAFLAQLRSAASQWDARGRDKGVLWRGDAQEEAVRFRKRFAGALAHRERDYLDAVVQLATRSTRLRRGAALGTIAMLSLIVAGGAIALFRIRRAEREAVHQATVAQLEATRAREAEGTVSQQLRIIRQEEAARVEAERQALDAVKAANLTREELESAYAKLQAQLIIIRRKEEQRQAAEEQAKTAVAAIDAVKAEATEAKADASEARAIAAMSRVDLEKALVEARVSLRSATEARAQAEQQRAIAKNATEHAQQSAADAKRAQERAEALAAKERARAEHLEKEKGKIATELR